MRTFLSTHWKSIIALIILVLLAVFVVPTGTASPALAARLQARADAMARHTAGPEGLDNAARYIASTLAAEGYPVHVQRQMASGQVLRTIEAWRSGEHTGQHPRRSFVIASRYGSPEDDEMTITAAMLELARLLKSVQPAAGTEIRFVFFVSRNPPTDPRFGSFVAYAGPRAALGQVSQALAVFRPPPEGAAGVLAAPAWVQGLTLSHLQSGDDGGMLLADIGALRSPCQPAAGDAGRPDFKSAARMLQQLALSVRALAGVTES